MPRPNRSTVDAFYDVFADMEPAEQEIAMKVLENTHRIAKRAAARATKPEAAAGTQIPLKEPASGE